MSKTTAVPSPPTWDQRGVNLDSLKLSFFVADDKQWQKRANDMGFSFKPESQDSALWVATFVALPENIIENEHYLSGEFHPTKSNGDSEIHWIIRWLTIPNNRPPEAILQSSKAVGGLQEIWSKLVKQWPSENSFSAKISASYVVDNSQWKCKLPKAYTKTIKTADGEAIELKTKGLNWEIEPPKCGISSITIAHSPKVLGLRIEYQKNKLIFNSELIRTIDTELWEVVSKTFLSKVSTHAAISKSTKPRPPPNPQFG